MATRQPKPLPEEVSPEWLHHVGERRGLVSLAKRAPTSRSFAMFDYSPEERAWRAQALCRDMDPDLFFPERGVSVMPAYVVCQGCAVRVECLEYSLTSGKDSEAGVRGGFTPHERKEIRAAMRADRKLTVQQAMIPWDQKRKRKLLKAQERERILLQMRAERTD